MNKHYLGESGYLRLLHDVISHGTRTANRTGIDTLTIPFALIEYDLSDGSFPIMRHKKMGLKSIAGELRAFLEGATLKSRFKELGSNIWAEWARPNHPDLQGLQGDDRKRKMLEIDELGKVYGALWNDFNGVNQLEELEKKLRTNPDDRRMVVSAWDPSLLHQAALPACHYAFQVVVIDGRLNLMASMRSVDLGLGLPYNLASYALLATLLAKLHGFKLGTVAISMANVHVYDNHVEPLKTAIARGEQVEKLLKPRLNFHTDPTGLTGWHPDDLFLSDYEPFPKISMEVAV